MSALATASSNTLLATKLQTTQARETVARTGATTTARWSMSTDEQPVLLPQEISAILTQVLQALAQGRTITVGSMPEEITTTVAARQLGISRPTLMKMVGAGEIPAHKVGSHTRLKTSDVLAFKTARLERQRAAFDELLELDDEEARETPPVK